MSLIFMKCIQNIFVLQRLHQKQKEQANLARKRIFVLSLCVSDDGCITHRSAIETASYLY